MLVLGGQDIRDREDSQRIWDLSDRLLRPGASGASQLQAVVTKEQFDRINRISENLFLILLVL